MQSMIIILVLIIKLFPLLFQVFINIFFNNAFFTLFLYFGKINLKEFIKDVKKNRLYFYIYFYELYKFSKIYH